VKTRSIMTTAAKTGTTALALCLVAGNAAMARCASPEEMTALKVAALRQQLMVAALTCHQASSFNRFVTSYREEFVTSDHALLRFFARESGSRADDAYNAYKTKMANDSSISSYNDPSFCGRAHMAFTAALTRNLPLAQLVADETQPTGFQSCMADNADTEGLSANAPSLPSRHRYMLDGAPVSAAPQREASLDAKPVAAAIPISPPVTSAPPAPPVNNVMPASDSDPGPAPTDRRYRDADNGPYAYSPYYSQANVYQPPAYGDYSRWWYAAQRPMQQVQGPDGRWYLIPADGR
jgi:hypothetical protein